MSRLLIHTPTSFILFYASSRGLATTPIDISSPFPSLSIRAPCSCLLELISSCVEPSQELLTSLGTQYAICTSHSRVEEHTGHGCAGDADSISEEKSNAKECGERYGSRKYRSSNWCCQSIFIFFFLLKCCRNDESVFLKAVDTVLVKLYAQFGKTKDLLTLFQEHNDVSLLEVEPVLQATRQYNALCLLYKQLGDDLKLLESWAK